MKKALIAFTLLSCAPRATYTLTPGEPPKTAIEHAASAINVSLCTAADITPEAKEVFTVLSSGSASTADKVFSGLLGGASALGKALACYLKDLGTQRVADSIAPTTVTPSGEVLVARRTDKEILQGRATVCDQGSHGFNPDACKSDLRKVAAYMILSQEKAGRIKID